MESCQWIRAINISYLLNTYETSFSADLDQQIVRKRYCEGLRRMGRGKLEGCEIDLRNPIDPPWHTPMIPFCYVDNLFKNACFIMKPIFLETSSCFLSIRKIWKGLDEFQPWYIVFKIGVFTEVAKNCPDHPMIHPCFGTFSMGTFPNLLKFGRCKLGDLWGFSILLWWRRNVFLNLKLICKVSLYH
jgi:hypothetical protein